MHLKLIRDTFTLDSTTGTLYIDGEQACFTLEDRKRPPGQKVHGSTCIPPGAYKVTITPSVRFKRPLPLLLSVPGFEGIRIHSGNRSKDTEGCILVGEERGFNVVMNSRVAFNRLFEKIDHALKNGEQVEIEITE